MTTRAPGPTGLDRWRSLLALYGPNPIPRFLDWTRRYGHVVRFQVGSSVFHLLDEPVSVKHVLQDNYGNYTKSRNYEEVRRVLGNGLLTSEGDFWLRQRRLAQPAFHHERLASQTEAMTGMIARRLAAWEAQAGAGAVIDVHEEMLGLTLSVVGQVLFGVDLDQSEHTVGPALTVAMRHVNRRLKSFVRLPPSWPTASERRFRQAVRALDDVVLRIVRGRQTTSDDRGDLLSMLLAARDEDTGRGMSETQLRDEVMTLLLAGHETTASALSWTFHLLARHPDVQDRLHAEVDAALSGRPPRHADLAALPYARQVLQEAMRLYPPAWLIERQAIADDAIARFHVPGGSMIGISPYTLHRHPDLWPEPDRFLPERFAAEASAARSRFSYLPFGAGPRVCIGSGLAMLDAHVILVMVAQAFTVATASNDEPEMEPLTTLRPRAGIPLKVLIRSPAARPRLEPVGAAV